MDLLNTRAARASVAQATEVDAGLRQFLVGVFNRMTGALVISGAVAMAWAAFMAPLMSTWVGLLFMLLPLAFVLVLSFGLHRLSLRTARLLFWAFAVSMGISLSTIFLKFAAVSIASTFFISAVVFLSASLMGYTTNRDLTNWGTFLLVGMIGILVAGLVNIWLASSALAFAINAIGVVIFTGLTAYDVQNLKNDYLTNGEVYGFDSPERSAIFGALGLYLNFVNIFQMLLELVGTRD